MKSLALAVLAAGASQRFGDKNKLLAQWRGQPLIAHTFSAFAATTFARRIIVVRKGDNALTGLCGKSAYEIVENSTAKTGIASSIACAAKTCDDCDGLMIALADMPLVKKATIAALSSAFQASADDAIIAPEFDNRRGHPVIFANAHFSELAGLRGDRGAASVIKNHSASYIGVPVDDEGIMLDFDAPADFQRN